MNERLVEHHRLAVAPVVVLTVDINVATGVVWRVQAQMVTVGPGIWVAMTDQFGTRRQFGEHRRLDRADTLQ